MVCSHGKKDHQDYDPFSHDVEVPVPAVIPLEEGTVGQAGAEANARETVDEDALESLSRIGEELDEMMRLSNVPRYSMNTTSLALLT